MANSSHMTGGLTPVDPNREDVQEMALFAINEANKKPQYDLIYEKVLTAKTQVVSGTMYHLVIEATNKRDTQKGTYFAKVWFKAWEHFKKLEEFHQLLQANAPQPMTN